MWLPKSILNFRIGSVSSIGGLIAATLTLSGIRGHRFEFQGPFGLFPRSGCGEVIRLHCSTGSLLTILHLALVSWKVCLSYRGLISQVLFPNKRGGYRKRSQRQNGDFRGIAASLQPWLECFCSAQRGQDCVWRCLPTPFLIDSRESFATETPIFIARAADSHESLEFPIRANHATKSVSVSVIKTEFNSKII